MSKLIKSRRAYKCHCCKSEISKGDFYAHWNWDHQSKDAAWDPESAGGVNYTGDMTTETGHGWNPAQNAATDAPWTDALVFLGEEN